jgi:hypothetical protein
VAPAASEPPSPNFLIGVGVGAMVQFPLGAAIAEAGLRVAGPLWLHGTIGEVAFVGIFSSGGANLMRGGLELQLGDVGNRLVLGVEAGTIGDEALVSPRIGFDLGKGSIHVRLCAEAEVLGSDGPAFAATATLALER